MKEVKTQIKVSRASCVEVKEAVRGAEAVDEMAAGGFAVDTGARTRATIAHETDVFLSSSLKSAVVKSGADAGESEHSSTEQSAPGGQPGKCQMGARKSGSNVHREEQAKHVWIRLEGKTRPIEVRRGKIKGLERERERKKSSRTTSSIHHDGSQHVQVQHRMLPLELATGCNLRL